MLPAMASSCAWWDIGCLLGELGAALQSLGNGIAGALNAGESQLLGDVQNALIHGEQDWNVISSQVTAAVTQAGGSPPVVIQQSSTVDGLISGALADGWSLAMSRTLIADVTAALDAGHLQLDAVEWKDLSFLGLGNVNLATSQFQSYIEQQGSQLYAWAVMEHDDFDAAGVQIKAYRLLLLHSQIQIGVGAIVAIMVAAFLALVVWQYVTKGESPILDELQKIWADLVSSTINPIAAAATEWYVVAIGVAGVAALAFGLAGKRLGVAPPPPPRPPSFEGEIKSKIGRFGVKT